MAQIYFYLILTTFFWGGSFLFTKLGLREIPPHLFVTLRFTLATLIMGMLVYRRLPKITPELFKRGTIVGIALGLTNLTFVFGIKDTSISRAGILNNLFVLFIPLITRVLWRDQIGKTNLAGIALAVVGIWLLAKGGAEGFNRGDIISTFCAFMIACHIITVSKVLKDDDVFLVSLIQFATVALMAALTLPLFPPPHGDYSWSALGAVIYCAIFPTICCFTLQNRFQRYVTPTRAGLIYTLDPVWSLLAGMLFLGEHLSQTEWIGCSLLFLAALVPLGIRYAQERLTGNRTLPASENS